MAEMKLEGMGMIAVSIGTAIVVMALMSIIISTIKDDTGIVPDNVAAFGGGNGTNQSLTWLGNNTNMEFQNPRVVLSSVVLYNNGSIVNSGANYTVTSAGLVITNQSTQGGDQWGSGQGDIITTALNVSFNYNYGSAAYNASQRGLEGQETLAGFLPIVALVAVGIILVGIVLTRLLNRQ